MNNKAKNVKLTAAEMALIRAALVRRLAHPWLR